MLYGRNDYNEREDEEPDDTDESEPTLDVYDDEIARIFAPEIAAEEYAQ